jgi:hypothetical protein
MSARARVDHTEKEKREMTQMRDTLKIERDALLDEQKGCLYTETIPTERPELVRAMSGMSECTTPSQHCSGPHTKNCRKIAIGK